MTISEMHIAFKLELDKTSSLELPAYESEEIDFWLNSAIKKFVKTRYSGVNFKGESFEQSQKRIDDLRTLVQQEVLSVTDSTFRTNTYIADLTDLVNGDYWFTLTEEVKIAHLSFIDTLLKVTTGNLVVNSAYRVVNNTITHNSVTYQIGDYFIAVNANYTATGTGSVVLASSSIESVKKANANTVTTLLQNPFSEHILHYEKASPLRLFLGNTVELITDGNYDVLLYYIRYLKKPKRVNILTTAYTTATADIQDDIIYTVSGNTVTYNGHTYSIAETFVGVSNVFAFTGTGTATANTASCDLPEHTHDEVVRLAVNMALENIEQPRYQSHANEIITME